MPSAQQFQEGFGLSVGQKYGSYQITNVNVQEKLEVLYNEYSFPSTIVLENRINPSMEEANKAIQFLFDSLNTIRIIYTDSGRPYKCTFFWVQPTITQESNYSKVTFITRGYGKRISKKEVERIQSDGKW